jgi:hypothetical protein
MSNLHRCFLPSFGSFGQAVSEKISKKLANQNQELSVAAIFDNGSGQNVHSLERTFHRCLLFSKTCIQSIQLVSPLHTILNCPVFLLFTWWEPCGFLAHLVKGYVSFYHHLASVVRRPLTFHILIFSSETPQPNKLKPNQKQELPVVAMFVNRSVQNEQSA